MQPSYEKHNINDYIGKKYGYLTVIGESKKSSRYSNHFDFQCDCGNVISEIPSRVISGHKKSCGKCRKRNTSYSLERKINDSIGIKFGHLTVLGLSHNSSNGRSYVKCKCDCGNVIDVLPNQLFRNNIKSCGCIKRNNELLANNKSTSCGNYHDGRTKHILYGTWNRMISRCENPNAKHYDRYGGRGISVCEEWHDFWNFVSWSDSIGGRPDGYTLDRIDNNGDYCPQNCRWVDWSTQASNKSSNRFIEFNGKTQTIHQWASEFQINEQTLTNRLNRGWNIEKALTSKTFVGNNQYTSAN